MGDDEDGSPPVGIKGWEAEVEECRRKGISQPTEAVSLVV